jgi:ankyrin repeat protein
MHAISENKNDVVRILIRAGANVKDFQGVLGRNPLLASLAYGNTEIVSDLVDAGADVNRQGGEIAVMSPLMLAAARGFREVVEILLGAGADVNARSEDKGKTALEYASDAGYGDIVELLKLHELRIDHSLNSNF